MHMNSTTPTYIVKIVDGKYSYTPSAWRVTSRTQVAADGKPTAANLAKYVASVEASTQPGGCNAHLGATKIKWAAIYRNDGSMKTVAEYRA